MNRRKLVFLSMAVIIGLGTMLLMRSAMNKPGKIADANTIEVLVAATDIPAGQFLQAQQARWQPWTKQHITEAFILKGGKKAGKDEEATVASGDFVGAVARKGIRAGEPILKGQIVKPQDRGFLSAVLNPGMRAVAAPITNVTGIAGFVFPGDHVDLILTHTMRSEDGSKTSQRRASVTVVKNARVLALDQNTNDQVTMQPKVAKVVTMEVDSKDAEKVTLALQLGTLSLSLRALAEDDSVGKAQPIGYQSQQYTLDSDVSELIPPPRVKQEISNQIVQVFRGKVKESESFTDKEENVSNIDETAAAR
jgi:pilus assembly protein CpaB